MWRSLRAWKCELLPTAGIIEGVLKKEKLAQSLIEPCVRKRGVGRQRKTPSHAARRPVPTSKISHKS